MTDPTPPDMDRVPVALARRIDGVCNQFEAAWKRGRPRIEDFLPERLRPDLDRDLETICLKCLDREPGRRYGGSAGALAEDLERWRAGEPIQGRRLTLPERTGRWVRHHPAIASLSGAVFLLLTIFGGMMGAKNVQLANSNSRLGDALETLGRKEDALNGALNVAELRREEAQHETWNAYLARIRAGCASGQRGQRFEGLRAVRQALTLPPSPNRPRLDLRNAAVACSCLPDVEVAREWTAKGGTVNLDFDPAFTRYARADASGNVTLHRADDDDPIAPLPNLGPVLGYDGLRFSPDGRFLWQRYEKGENWPLDLWRLDGSKPVHVVHLDHASGASFRADSRRLAVTGTDGTLRLFDTETGKVARVVERTLATALGVHFHPRRAGIVAITMPRQIRVLDLEEEKELMACETPGPPGVAWHPEGDVLAFASADLRIRLVHITTGRDVVPPLTGHLHHGIVLAFDRSGDTLASNDWSKVLRLWDTRSGRLMLDMPQTTTNGLRFSPDDRLLATGIKGDRLQLLRVATGSELTRITGTHAEGRPPRRFGLPLVPDPDGRLVAATVAEGTVLVDLLRREERGLLPLSIPYSLRPFRFEPGGSMVTTGRRGVQRWPPAIDPKPGESLFGRPQLLVDYRATDTWGTSADGRVLAMPAYEAGGLVVHLDRPKLFIPLAQQADVRHCAVSPDGRYVATGCHERGSVRVWEASDGSLLRELWSSPGKPAFSPDGAWLAVVSDADGGRCRTWHVGTWEPAADVPCNEESWLCFAPDSRSLAVTGERGLPMLVDPATGRELVKLFSPDKTRFLPGCFTPDGSRLIAVGKESSNLYVWDLRAIRHRLRTIGLDWDESLPPVQAFGDRRGK